MNKISKNIEFDNYWLSYLKSHTNPANRMCHYIGTSIGVVGGLLGFIYINILVGILIGIVGYSIALIGHFIFQKNSPHATKPHLGVLCDFLMLYLYVFDRNRLKQQLERLKD
ncbi:DUF962 domain-containing protein [Spartinivicinus ruber]|uniref:DUF962 domain-containing protein n=1 Tax=Spartinivicinus ruber TaxID=2683272 RepID=UPI0013D68C4B|nr:DUF962 domain-containing protein [Spartinivicinus ruber]